MASKLKKFIGWIRPICPVAGVCAIEMSRWERGVYRTCSCGQEDCHYCSGEENCKWCKSGE